MRPDCVHRAAATRQISHPVRSVQLLLASDVLHRTLHGHHSEFVLAGHLWRAHMVSPIDLLNRFLDDDPSRATRFGVRLHSIINPLAPFRS